MYYIKRDKESIFTTSIPVCTMERHQAGQEEALVEIRLGKDSLEAVHRPRSSPGCFKCAVAVVAVMGLVIAALVAGFILHFFMFTPSCNQDARPSSDTAKLNVTCKLRMTGEQGRHDIFTVNKTATYLIYGWLKLSDDTSEEVTVMQTLKKKTRTIQRKKCEGEICFLGQKVKLINGSRISIHFTSPYTDSSFHVYEL